ncbi:hypothetical protein EXIGLDRAFT_723046 [Exidia glandulosa HHB12029]|uniref:Uncharacterized protein n=1 Tax=Exidia glandulosa HHB12029 TaxID=1314781 RepID=A0A165EZ70_EXIGL|nr:hypothetical protein EXIGLDRAFT_723046 [Exidia glandulosa HHB12029]
MEAERDAAALKLDRVRAELRELKRARPVPDESEVDKPGKKKRKRKADRDDAPCIQLAQLTASNGAFACLTIWLGLYFGLICSGAPALVDAFKIVQSFTAGSKGVTTNCEKLMTRITSALSSVRASALSDVARLVQSTIDIAQQADLDNVALAAVLRVEAGSPEARAVVQASLPRAADCVLLSSLRALVRLLSRLLAGPRRRNRLVLKDSVCVLCWAVTASVDAGARDMDEGNVVLLELLELADAADTVMRGMVLSAVERAWLRD